ncbi:hypothetical protein CE195_08265, partial [Sodalis-like symbiont of Philaenus spumarius]
MCIEREQNLQPFFFKERTINAIVYLDMVQQFLIPQINEDDEERNVYFMQDGAPPHYLTDVKDFLNDHFSGQWIGRDAPIAWSPRSPDPTPLDFFLWGFIKAIDYLPLLPASL